MAYFLQARVESQLAFPGRLCHHRNHHHQDVSRPHRGRCQEFTLRSEAQEVHFSPIYKTLDFILTPKIGIPHIRNLRLNINCLVADLRSSNLRYLLVLH